MGVIQAGTLLLLCSCAHYVGVAKMTRSCHRFHPQTLELISLRVIAGARLEAWFMTFFYYYLFFFYSIVFVLLHGTLFFLSGFGIYIDDASFSRYRRVVQRLAQQGKLSVVFSDESLVSTISISRLLRRLSDTSPFMDTINF